MTEVLDGTLLARIDQLQASYAKALDALDMEAWVANFSPTRGQYELTTAENVKLGLPVGMMLDDCYERLQDRIKFVNEVWAQAVEHYQPRHLLYRSGCEQDGDGYRVTTNFSVFYTNAEGKSNLLVAGIYEDRVVEEKGELKFAAKRAIMDTSVPPRYLIYPV